MSDQSPTPDLLRAPITSPLPPASRARKRRRTQSSSLEFLNLVDPTLHPNAEVPTSESQVTASRQAAGPLMTRSKRKVKIGVPIARTSARLVTRPNQLSSANSRSRTTTLGAQIPAANLTVMPRPVVQPTTVTQDLSTLRRPPPNLSRALDDADPGSKLRTEFCGIFSAAKNPQPICDVRYRDRDLAYACPICGATFARSRTVRDHFPVCVRRNGNPDSKKWNDDVTCADYVGRGTSDYNDDRPSWELNHPSAVEQKQNPSCKHNNLSMQKHIK